MTTSFAPEGASPTDAPQLRILAQYVKDLSFENPLAAAAARANESQPVIDMGVEVKSRPVGNEGNVYEVDLRIHVEAKRGTDTLFLADLVYAGLFQFVNVRSDDVELLLWVECPRLLFPFSRQLLAEITREGGYPPLLINPIDFSPLYQAEVMNRSKSQDQDPGPTAGPTGSAP